MLKDIWDLFWVLLSPTYFYYTLLFACYQRPPKIVESCRNVYNPSFVFMYLSTFSILLFCWKFIWKISAYYVCYIHYPFAKQFAILVIKNFNTVKAFIISILGTVITSILLLLSSLLLLSKIHQNLRNHVAM